MPQKPDDLSSIPRTHIRGGKRDPAPHNCPLISTLTVVLEHIHTNTVVIVLIIIIITIYKVFKCYQKLSKINYTKASIQRN